MRSKRAGEKATPAAPVRAATAGRATGVAGAACRDARRGHRRLRTFRRLFARPLTLGMVLAATGCTRAQWQNFPSPDDVIAAVPWFATMHRGLAIQPYQMPRPPVEGTVPVGGTQVVPQVLPANLPQLDAMKDPVQRTAESINRGKELFTVYCEPCHGATGHGDGPIVPKFIKPPDLTAAQARGYSDGYIYAMIANGRGLMPPYGDKVHGDDRWNLVNYVRAVIQAEQQ